MDGGERKVNGEIEGREWKGRTRKWSSRRVRKGKGKEIERGGKGDN